MSINPRLKAQLLQRLSRRQQNRNAGFTLIELLVVIIIIGILSVIALPNLLGQVGKARESEATNTLGSLNRAQEANFVEKGSFAGSINDLPVSVDEGFYSFSVDTSNSTQAVQAAVAQSPQSNGIRDHAGGVGYNATNQNFNNIICRETSVNNSDNIAKPHES